MQRIAIIGAGAWGTALATVARRAGREVVLRAHEPAVAAAINREHANPDFLPGIALDPGIRATADLTEAVDGADVVLLVTPAQYLRGIVAALEVHRGAGVPLVVCAKGIELTTGRLMSEVVAEEAPDAPVAVLSGPTFAAEVARGLPTAVTLACPERDCATMLADALGTQTFRPYTAEDVIGAEVAGAVKNVIAIACGIVEGRALGQNARAAVIARGLAEVARFADALGGDRRTLLGLSGLGDLTLTCTSTASRNYALGAALGAGTPLPELLANRRSVAEGVTTAPAVLIRAAEAGIEMPISAAVNAVLDGGAGIAETISALLARPLRTEC